MKANIQPYREIATMEECEQLPEHIAKFLPISDGGQLLTEGRKTWAACPKCANITLHVVVNTENIICKGTSNRWYDWWKPVCKETREHFHIHCKFCKHQYLMATKDTSTWDNRDSMRPTNSIANVINPASTLDEYISAFRSNT